MPFFIASIVNTVVLKLLEVGLTLYLMLKCDQTSHVMYNYK